MYSILQNFICSSYFSMIFVICITSWKWGSMDGIECLIVLSQKNWHLRLDKFGSCQFFRNATKNIKLKMILQTMSVYPYVSVLTRQRNWHLSELTRHNPIKVSNCCQRHVLWRYTCFYKKELFSCDANFDTSPSHNFLSKCDVNFPMVLKILLLPL